MTARTLRIDPCAGARGARVVAAPPISQTHHVVVVRATPERLAGIDGLVDDAAAHGRRVVVDVTAPVLEEEIVAGVWALGCGAEVVTSVAAELAAAAAVLPPDRGRVHRW